MRIALLSIPQINSHTFAKKKKRKKKSSRMPTMALSIREKLWEKTNMPTITEDGYLT